MWTFVKDSAVLSFGKSELSLFLLHTQVKRKESCFSMILQAQYFDTSEIKQGMICVHRFVDLYETCNSNTLLLFLWAKC